MTSLLKRRARKIVGMFKCFIMLLMRSHPLIISLIFLSVFSIDRGSKKPTWRNEVFNFVCVVICVFVMLIGMLRVDCIVLSR